MNRSRSLRGIAIPAAALVVGLIIGSLFTGAVLGRSGGTAPPADPSPSPSPIATPSPLPSPKPTDDLSDGSVRIPLDVANDDEVFVTVEDWSRLVAEARSARAGDGMSVRWYEMKVENLDAETLRVTWVGFPVDDEVLLRIQPMDGGYDLTLVQPGPPPNSDALGFDRVLVLKFHQPVSAEDVSTSVQGSLDTGG
jgi:hypothetical protein